MTPFEEDDNINFFLKMNAMLEAYRISKSHFPNYFIHNIYPEKDGLLPWGYTDNGDELYWKTNDSPEYHEFKMQLAEFLYKIITGELICDVFPEYLSEGKVDYTSVELK